MPTTKQSCDRCGAQITDSDPHVWLTLQSVNLGYEPLDDEHIVCESCYEAYRNFISQPAQQDRQK